MGGRTGFKEMGYRKPKTQSEDASRWKAFVREQKESVVACGLPMSYLQNQNLFEDFLMHGCIDHHDDSIGVTLREMTEGEKGYLFKLVRAYFKAGFKNPGLVVFSSKEERRLRAECPEAFVGDKN